MLFETYPNLPFYNKHYGACFGVTFGEIDN